MNTIDILGVRIADVNLDSASVKIEEWIRLRQQAYVCLAPVSTIVDCQKDPQYRNIINSAGMATPDGMPLVWIGRSRGSRSMARTYGPDLLLKMCGLGLGKKCRHYFYGGSASVLDKLISRLRERFPGIDIAGSWAPDVLAVGQRESEDVIRQINASGADLLWVGLGSPKQDYWMFHHRDKITIPVMLGVGAAFDFISGEKKQAPLWMRRSGLEWFFRLCSEPRRLWRRYLIGNMYFVFLFIKDWVYRFLLGSGHGCKR